MWFDANVSINETPVLFRRTVEIATPRLLSRRFQAFGHQIHGMPALVHYLDTRYCVERGIQKIIDYKRSTGRFPDAISNEQQNIHRAISFSAMLAKVHAHLPPAYRGRLAGRVHRGLNSFDGLESLGHELGACAHLMLNQFDVTWSDLINGGGADFLAVKQGLEIEVECKVCTADLGRKIHAQKFYELMRLLQADVINLLQTHGSMFVRITIPRRLDNEHIKPIGGVVKRSLITNTSSFRENVCKVTLQSLALNKLPFEMTSHSPRIDQDALRTFLEQQYGVSNQYNYVLLNPKLGVVIVTIDSEIKDEVLRGIERQLKEAARQLSTDRPGFISCLLQDISPQQLYEIAKQSEARQGGSALHRLMQNFFSAPHRAHVHTVTFTTHGLLNTKTVFLGATMHRTAMERSPAYAFINNIHPLKDEPKLKLT